VSPGYFDTLRLPLVRGREFSDVDVSDAAPVAIVNETLAQRLWPGSNAVGKRLRVDGATEPWREVIGVARDAKYVLLSESPRPAYYVPLRADAVSRRSLLVRIAGDSRAALSSLTTIAHDLDPNLPLITLQTLEERIHQSVNLHRAAASLFNVLGGLTLLLAAVGLYGVAAHSVSLRTREIGVRMSLGARAADIFGMVVRENLSLSLIGVGVGLGIGVVGLMILTSFLFGLTSTDPLAFVGGSSILCLITLLATYIPARRAANLDPLAALRHE
jgi:predicted permease